MLPAIFAAISGAVELFSTGKQVYEAVTGKPSTATDAASLQGEVAALPADQQAAFTSRMKAEIELYAAQTERLRVQGGEVNAETLEQFTSETRDYIGVLRMATRPLVVRRLVHYMMLPLYLIGIDVALSLLNVFLRFADGVRAMTTPAGQSIDLLPQFDLVGAKFFEEGVIYHTMYTAGVVPAASIVISYMTLREIGKAGGPKALGQSITGSIKKIMGVFK